MFDVKEALRELVEKEGSDLHLKVDSRPLYRVQRSSPSTRAPRC